VRAILHQGDEADLRKGAAPAAGAGPAEGFIVGRIVGDIERAAVDADQPPAPIPGAPRRLGGDRPNHLVVQLTQRLPSKPRTGLRDAGLPRHLDLNRRVQPLDALQQATKHLPTGRLHEQRQSDYVIDHHVSRKIALPDTRFAGRL
jgi:hypothetical protein